MALLGRLPRPQPGDGLAVRGRARHAGARPRARCVRALPPIAIGHEAAIAALVAALVLGLGLLADPRRCSVGAGVALIAFGVFRFVRPRAHSAGRAMRVNRRRARLVVVPDGERPRRGADGRARADRRGRGGRGGDDHALAAVAEHGFSLPASAPSGSCCTSAPCSR